MQTQFLTVLIYGDKEPINLDFSFPVVPRIDETLFMESLPEYGVAIVREIGHSIKDRSDGVKVCTLLIYLDAEV